MVNAAKKFIELNEQLTVVRAANADKPVASNCAPNEIPSSTVTSAASSSCLPLHIQNALEVATTAAAASQPEPGRNNGGNTILIVESHRNRGRPWRRGGWNHRGRGQNGGEPPFKRYREF